MASSWLEVSAAPAAGAAVLYTSKLLQVGARYGISAPACNDLRLELSVVGFVGGDLGIADDPLDGVR